MRAIGNGEDNEVQPRLRVAVVGAGTMGRVHVEAVAASRRGELVGVVDPDPAGQRLAAERGVAAFHSVDDLPSAGIDALIIAVPTDGHAALTEKAFARGWHVLVEKPMARTLEQAQAMMNASAAAGTRLMVGQVVRYFPEYVRARDTVLAGGIGQVAVARTFRGGPYPRGRDDWYGDPARSGGLFVDLLIHDFDFLVSTFGIPEEITARVRAVDGMPRHAAALVRFPGGLAAELIGSWLHPRFHTRFELAGSGGLLEHNSLDRATLVVEAAGLTTAAVAVPSSPHHRSPYQDEVDDFIDGVLDARPFRVEAEDALVALGCALWAHRAAETRVPLTRREWEGSS